MKQEKFDAKSFLKAKVLSPLEQNKIKGGLNGVVRVQQQVVQQQQRVVQVIG